MDRHTLEQLRIKVEGLLRFGSPGCIRQAHGIMAENFENVLGFALDLTEPKPKPVHTIADNYPAGGLTSTEPCMFCEDYNNLESKYDTIKASHDKLVSDLKKYGKHINNHNQFCETYKHSDFECNCGFEQALKESKL